MNGNNGNGPGVTVDPLEHIILLIKSRYPLIWIDSHEEERVLLHLAKYNHAAGKFLFTWDSARGMCLVRLTTGEDSDIEYLVYQPVAGDLWNMELKKQLIKDMSFEEDEFGSGPQPPFRTYSEGLLFASALGSKATFVFLDVHVYLDKKSGEYTSDRVRLMKNVCMSFTCEQATYMKSLVVLSAVRAVPPEIDKLTAVVDFNLPDRKVLREELEKQLQLYRVTFQKIVHRFEFTGPEQYEIVQAGLGLTTGEFRDCLNYSVQSFYSQEGKVIRPAVIQRFKESLVKKAKLLEFIKPVKMSEVGGLANVKKVMEENKWGLSPKARKIGASMDKGILLVGLAGSGKSLVVKASASVLGVNVLRLDMGAVFRGLVGESEATIKHALALAAANAPCILWIDEIEKALSGVESSSRTDSGVTARVFGILLTFMQETEEEILFFATCNEIESLAEPLKRRFTRIMFVDLPGYQARLQILKIHLLKQRTPEQEPRDIKDFDLPRLAEISLAYTGAEIEMAITRAIKSGGFRRGKFETEDVERELEAIVPMSERAAPQIKALRDSLKGLVEWADDETIEKELHERKAKGQKLGLELG